MLKKQMWALMLGINRVWKTSVIFTEFLSITKMPGSQIRNCSGLVGTAVAEWLLLHPAGSAAATRVSSGKGTFPSPGESPSPCNGVTWVYAGCFASNYWSSTVSDCPAWSRAYDTAVETIHRPTPYPGQILSSPVQFLPLPPFPPASTPLSSC